jgi:hypothetical protein
MARNGQDVTGQGQEVIRSGSILTRVAPAFKLPF